MLFMTMSYIHNDHRLMWFILFLVIGLMGLALSIQRHFQMYGYIIGRVMAYHFAIIALIVGSLFITPLIPTILTLPFQLLIQLAMVFLTVWQTYLFMTYAFLQRAPSVTRANLIVLGAGIYTEAVTPMLKARLDRAILLSRQLEQFHIIVSGGQGPDEPISEALAMQRYLLQQGIAPQQISMEAQSTNTRQNIFYSKRYLALHKQPHTVIVTSSFHILRALRLAERQQVRAFGYGAPTPHHWVSRELIRDYSGLLFQYPWAWVCFSVIQISICISNLFA
ncbi:hypothetical protein B4W74_07795 [Staphylococcus intermedius]|nr:hypothetical protein B5C04_07445 [Staphylococcus intermedius]PCF79093.1 hypothetical protein B4W74_07795 [Staphylococcus intermedius]PCF80067.1 hypothetical protein B4W70_07435 [Staphylococcus intermedius]PCF86947.1 hypothetical protein B4W76_06870 [Staphylococcus intermedius]PNZ52022.1 YdcF family protein [Staphylococcus intermedius NCTC 11048]